jgi:hypothetical protein
MSLRCKQGLGRMSITTTALVTRCVACSNNINIPTKSFTDDLVTKVTTPANNVVVTRLRTCHARTMMTSCDTVAAAGEKRSSRQVDFEYVCARHSLPFKSPLFRKLAKCQTITARLSKVLWKNRFVDSRKFARTMFPSQRRRKKPLRAAFTSDRLFEHTRTHTHTHTRTRTRKGALMIRATTSELTSFESRSDST